MGTTESVVIMGFDSLVMEYLTSIKVSTVSLVSQAGNKFEQNKQSIDLSYDPDPFNGVPCSHRRYT